MCHTSKDVSLTNGGVKIPVRVTVVALGENIILPCSDDPMKDKSMGFGRGKGHKVAQTG